MFSEVASDLGELVTLHGDDDYTVTALVESIEDVSGDEEQADFQSVVRLSSVDKFRLQSATAMTMRGFKWHILEPLPELAGMIAVQVQRKASENTRADEFDINDEQAQWK